MKNYSIAESVLNIWNNTGENWESIFPAHVSDFELRDNNSFDSSIVCTFEDGSKLVVDNPDNLAFPTSVHFPY